MRYHIFHIFRLSWTYTACYLVAWCTVIGPVCLFVCLWVSYYDNSKLRASICNKLGLYMKAVTVSSWLNFGRPASLGRGSAAGWKFFGSALLQPGRSVCVSSKCSFSLDSVGQLATHRVPGLTRGPEFLQYSERPTQVRKPMATLSIASPSSAINLYLNGHFSNWTRDCRYQNVAIRDFTGAKDGGSGSYKLQLEL